MRATLRRIEAGGDEALAEAWFVWAQTVLATSGIPELIPKTNVEKMLPVVFHFDRHSTKSRDEVYAAVQPSVLQALWHAKLDDRHELNIEDARRAVAKLKADLGLIPPGVN